MVSTSIIVIASLTFFAIILIVGMIIDTLNKKAQMKYDTINRTLDILEEHLKNQEHP